MIVAYGCNRGWYKYLVVNIYSLLRHNDKVKKIYVLCEDDDIENIKYLSKIRDKFDVEIVVLNVKNKISKYFTNSHNTNTVYTDYAYAKLLVSEISYEDKVLYLDTDIIIRGDISSIWDFELDNYYAAGVMDNGGHLGNHKQSLGITGKYINTGVILYNCKKIREESLVEKFFNIINEKDLIYPDQDAFNMVCSDKLLYISSMYNFAMNNAFNVTRYVFDKRFRKVIHYTGSKIDWVADKYYSEEWYVEYNSFYDDIVNSKKNKDIKVAFCSNRKLYKYLPININSLLKYNDRIGKIYLILEDDDINDIKYLKEVLDKYSVDVEVVNFSKVQFDYLNRNSENLDTIFSNFCFAKLVLSELTNEDKIIYLDMDTIVRGDISLLWKLDLDNYYALGCRDYGVLDENYHYGTLNTNCKYINTGVMVLNLNKIRNDELVSKLFDFINSRKLVYPDQDAFNLVCDSAIGYIPSIFNCVWGVTKEVMDYEKAVIFHFPGEKLYWVTERKHSEEFYYELDMWKKEYNIHGFSLY